ncbi:hypothetical protein GGP85_003018 [Salinibacter ruber]|uniref:hypothetical protein n=1 Tax=Salinibacter ruber TaxID=146919 RepID=UPI002166F2F2|nr:hypothetical protein [Salinibacter ruber]MCS3827548.1 hypothetical protein [Salinibacter ruber]
MSDLDDAAERGSQKKSNLDEAVRDQGTTRLTVDLPNDLHQDLKVQAAKENRTMKNVTMEALKDYLDEDE